MFAETVDFGRELLVAGQGIASLPWLIIAPIAVGVMIFLSIVGTIINNSNRLDELEKRT